MAYGLLPINSMNANGNWSIQGMLCIQNSQYNVFLH